MNLELVCKVRFNQKNSATCEKYNQDELSKIWLSFLPSLQLIQHPATWGVHPLGLSFVIKLLKQFWRVKNYLGQVFTSIFCVMSLDHIKTYTTLISEVYIPKIPLRELMFLSLKELSEVLDRWNITINARIIMKMAGNLGYNEYLLSSESNLGFDVIHNFTLHSKNFCAGCNKKSLICAICLSLVNTLGMFCKACGHGGHLIHQKQWFYRENVCPAGCGCNCLSKLSSCSEVFYNRYVTR
jgi:Zinc-ribbon, C4HC2 type